MSTIAIDLDGVVVDLLPTLLARYNLLCNDFVQVEDVTDYALRKVCKKTVDSHDVSSVLDAPGFYHGLPPIPGAVEGIAQLRAAHHDIILVTSRPLRALIETSEWVFQHLGDMPNLVFAQRKERVPADVLFDDCADTLRDYCAQWPRSRTATIAYPYNVSARRWARVVGHYTQPAAAWTAFADWIEGLLW
jgi:5'(3')-deoxyribonucleotidase